MNVMNPQRMLVVMAHPDDIELGCFGLIKKMTLRGSKCSVVIATNGEKGLVDPKNNFINRKDEAEKSLSNLVDDIIWLEKEDGNVKLDNRLIENLRQIIVNINPQIVITHFPDEIGIEHQDHNVIGKATISASIRYGSKMNCLLLSEPLFYFYSNFKPNCFVDITNEYESKIKALKKHESQKEKFYMSEFFQLERASRLSSYCNTHDTNCVPKYELFHIFFEKFI